MALRHDTTHPRSALWGADHTTGTESEGDILVYEGGEWVAKAPGDADVGGGSGKLVISDAHSTPLVFDDIIQTEATDDFVYEDT